MTQWNLIYYRRKGFNRGAKGAAESITADGSFLPLETPILDGLIRAKISGAVFRDEIREFIVLSPALTFNLLNVAHSSYIKQAMSIAGINDLISIIGNDIVAGLLKEYIERSCLIRRYPGINPYTDENFYTAVRAANLALLLADETGYSSQFSAYVAALLHNIGAVVLAARFPVIYNRVVLSGNVNFSSHVQSEENILGINHCYVGARMVEGWGSFPFLSDAIFYHHHPLNKVRQANRLLKLCYFSSMIENKDGEERLRYLEAGKELFGFSPNQIDEYISIADLKAQGRLMKLGIEPGFNKGEPFYKAPDRAIEMISTGDSAAHSFVNVIAERIQKSENKNDRLRFIGQAIHAITGIDEILYFRQNTDGKSLYGISLKDPDNASLSNDLLISLDEKESIIVASFLMGMEINSLDRVDSTSPDLFDLQVSNYMNRVGLYCLPVIRNGKVSGVLAAGVDSSDSLSGEAGHRIRGLVESLFSRLVEDDVQNETGASANKNGSDPIKMRKLIHEINNPLSAIKNFLKVLNMKLDDINVESNEIKIIDDELNRIAKLLKEFKSSSPDETKVKSTSSIKDIISDTIMLIRNSRVNGPEVNITVQAGDNIPEIMIDRDAFRQVLINLVNNAIEAMPEGGNITVTAQYKQAPNVFNSRSVSADAERERIEISISDDGPGIPDSMKASVFKKQSTTKADHDGLGLLIVYELVKRMGGTITFNNNSDRGTCFKITMPVN
jgi:signal transduction histidine kinase/HD-like signal output (HDOD) protein